MKSNQLIVNLLLLMTAALFSSTATAEPMQTVGMQPVALNLSQQKFSPAPGYPACMSMAVLSGNPAKEPSLIVLKFKSGCTVPWHWHTPNEHLMLASGVGKAEMKGGKMVTLKSGGYVLVPAHEVHMFTCKYRCVLFLSSDGPFDTHYVDATGNEIPPEQALKK
ncbi:MAG: cupin domain-containing protein [Gammaproteobacteria bacterium]|nr:cupin domain-containing protein [Gammaproteobacteria bacterium]